MAKKDLSRKGKMLLRFIQEFEGMTAAEYGAGLDISTTTASRTIVSELVWHRNLARFVKEEDGKSHVYLTDAGKAYEIEHLLQDEEDLVED